MCNTLDLDQLARQVVDRDLYANQSLLVTKLLGEELIGYEDIENAYDESLDTIKEYLIHEADIDEDKLTDLSEEEIRALAEEHNFCPPVHDIYEWWLVSDWLADHLRRFDEPILDTDYGTWWGRTCTGQAILLDGIIQQIMNSIYK